MEITPSDLTIMEGDTSVIRVIVRNASEQQIQPGAPRYILNWKAINLDVLAVGSAVTNTFTIRGAVGGVAELEVEVVPFVTPSSGGALASAGASLRAKAVVRVVGRPAEIVIVSGDGQAGQPGEPLHEEIGVRVLDRRGSAVIGHEVRFDVKSGGGQATPSPTVTDDSGHARVSWKLGTTIGEQVLEPVAGDLNGPVVTAVAVPAATAIIGISGSGQIAHAGTELPDSLVVQVRDAGGHGVAGVAVDWNVTRGGGAVSPERSVTDGAGYARASWTLGSTFGRQRVVAEAAGIGEVGFAATATSGAPQGAARIVVTPDAAVIEALGFQTSLVATVFDAADQVMPDQEVSWMSLADAIATVDGDGIVTAHGVGTALIVARSGNVADTAAVTVQQTPVSVGLNAGIVILQVGGSQQLEAVVRDAGGSVIADAPVAWSSSASTVASVSSSGLVSAISKGITVVSAVSGKASAHAAVSVTGPSD